MPRGALIVLVVAILLLLASLYNYLKKEEGNPIARKAWLRTAAIMIVVSLVITYIHNSS